MMTQSTASPRSRSRKYGIQRDMNHTARDATAIPMSAPAMTSVGQWTHR